MGERNAEIVEVAKDTGGQITEKITGNKFLKLVHKYDPTYIPEYNVPSVLDHEIKQDNGASIALKGPKEDFQVRYRGQNFSLLLNDVVPDGTVFAMQESNLQGFEADEEEHKILAPSNLALLKRHTMYGFIHEGSHLWQDQDEEFLKAQNEAKGILGKKLLTPFAEETLSRNSEEKQTEKNAWKTIGDDEKRAAEIALYIMGRLRSLGTDVLPQYPDAQSLTSLVNPSLKSHENFDQKLTLSQLEIEKLINGELPYLALKEKIDARLIKLPIKPLNPATP